MRALRRTGFLGLGCSSCPLCSAGRCFPPNRLATTRARWSVQSEEHPWKSLDGDSGFLDLVLVQALNPNTDLPSTVLGVECKRSFSDWIFLVKSDDNSGQERANALWLSRPKKGGMNWAEFNAHPSSYESAFAVVRREKESKPGLELEGHARGVISALHGLQSQVPAAVGHTLYVPIFSRLLSCGSYGSIRSVSIYQTGQSGERKRRPKRSR